MRVTTILTCAAITLAGCDNSTGGSAQLSISMEALTVAEGTSVSVSWLCNGLVPATVDLQISYDGGTTWTLIAAGVSTGVSGGGANSLFSGSYSWQVTTGALPRPQTQCVMAATNAAGDELARTGIFTIRDSQVWYFDSGAAAGGDGTSWAQAFDSVSAIGTVAASGDECWLASGTYTVGSTLQVGRSAVIRGGFVGNESTAAGRQPWVNETVLRPPTGVSHPVLTAEGIGALTLDGIVFQGSTVPASGTGALVQLDVSELDVVDCVFQSASSDRTAALHLRGGDEVAIHKCIFSGNTAAGGYSSAMDAESITTIQVSEVLFVGNVGSRVLAILDAQTATVTGCTFTSNTSPHEAIAIVGTTVRVANSVFWGNTSSPVYFSATPTAYSLIEGGYPGTGNTGADPLFANAADPDGADNTWGTIDDGLRVPSGSPCIDAGDNASVGAGVTTDIAGSARLAEDPGTTDTGAGTPPIVDMGAYEYTP